MAEYHHQLKIVMMGQEKIAVREIQVDSILGCASRGHKPSCHKHFYNSAPGHQLGPGWKWYGHVTWHELVLVVNLSSRCREAGRHHLLIFPAAANSLLVLFWSVLFSYSLTGHLYISWFVKALQKASKSSSSITPSEISWVGSHSRV